MTLKYCPFCGGQPVFSNPEWKDDNRYVQLTLECCYVTVSDSLGYGQARGMDDDAIRETLTGSLTTLWNDRYVPEREDLQPKIHTATLEEVVKQFDSKFGKF